MPLSDPARQVLETAVGLNPDGARLLLAILRTAPTAVKYKPQDRFGPLGMMVSEYGGAARNPSLRGLSRPDLALELHGAAEIFQREWLAQSFTKAELADELERCLDQFGEQAPPHGGSWQTIRGDADGLDPLSSIFTGPTRLRTAGSILPP